MCHSCCGEPLARVRVFIANSWDQALDAMGGYAALSYGVAIERRRPTGAEASRRRRDAATCCLLFAHSGRAPLSHLPLNKWLPLSSIFFFRECGLMPRERRGVFLIFFDARQDGAVYLSWHVVAIIPMKYIYINRSDSHMYHVGESGYNHLVVQ